MASIVRGLLREAPGSRPPQLAGRVRRAVEGLEAEDPLFPRGVSDRIAQEAYRQLVVAVQKEEFGVIVLPGGRVICVRTTRSVRPRRTDGAREHFFQPMRWAELPWADFEAVVADLAKQRDALGDKVGAFAVVLPLRDKYPDTATPAEACEREGIDWRNLDRRGMP